MAPINVAANGDMQWCELRYNGLVLKYSIGYWGTQSVKGYPLFIGLHGGGGHDAGKFTMNDKEWKKMTKQYYVGSVKALAGSDGKGPGGVYVALRGVTSLDDNGALKDEYNIHWRPEGYIMIQELIKNLSQASPAEIHTAHDNLSGTLNINAKYFVNTSQVHLIGFSAGGDGAFNLVRSLPDTFASVVPAAGYATMPDATTKDQPIVDFFENYVNTPVWMQVGEKDNHYFKADDGYGRSERAKYYYMYWDNLNKLQSALDSKTYEHWLSIVKGGSHNSWFWWETPDEVDDCLTDLPKWYTNISDPGARASKGLDLNPVRWCNSKTRPLDPNYVIWNLGQRLPHPKLLNGVPWEQKRFNYWLFDRKPSVTAALKPDFTIWAHSDTENGKTTITINEPTEFLGILLRETSASFGQPIKVTKKDGTWSGEVNITSNKELMKEVWQARGDPHLLYTALLYFEKDGGQQWQVKVAQSLHDGGAENVIPSLIT